MQPTIWKRLDAPPRPAPGPRWTESGRPRAFIPFYFGILLATQMLVGTEPVRVVPIVFALNLLLGVLAVLALVWVFRPRVGDCFSPFQ